MKIINIALCLFVFAAIAGIIVYAKSQGVAVLEPQGLISIHQRDIFLLAVGLGLTALIPVFIMTILIVYRYRAGVQKSSKQVNHNWEIKPLASWMWATFIVAIITVLAVFMYKSTFAIDPYKPIANAEDSLTVRVVALPWKWLFIYPEEDIATVNELVIPVNKPISFELTADAPMSSFWIPKLGSMIYTMEGMVTKLHLIASSSGEFEGMNTEINGEGYSGMRFKTRAISMAEYDEWVAEVKQSEKILVTSTYEKLAEKSIANPVQYYASTDPALFGQILAKFMNHASESEVLGETHHHAH